MELTIKRILSYYKFYKFKLVLVIIVKIIGTALDLVIPFLLSFILDKILPNIDVNNYLNIIIFTDLQSSLSASERVFELIDIDKEKEDDINYVELSKIEGNIYFENVKFSYVKNHPIINNLTLNVKKGQQIAIVGPTGAGKMTIVNLLMRFYEIDDGAIYLDQININKIKKSTLRKSFAMVLQETWLFEGTVYDNLTYGNEKVNLNEVIEACKKKSYS